MILCKRNWTERYVTATRNVSIQTTPHACSQQEDHDNPAEVKKPTPCVCRCGHRRPA